MSHLAALLLVAAAAATPPEQESVTPGTPPEVPRTLALADAVRSAIEHQPQLLQARAVAEAAAARSDLARSNLLPQLNGTASYSRETANFTPRPGLTTSAARTSSSWDTVNFWSFGATLSQLVFDFGQTSGRWRAALASADAQRSSERMTRIQVVLGVEIAYFTARAGKDLVRVARDNLANQENHLRQVEGFVRAGARPDIDLAQARTDRANAEVQLINAQNAYDTERAQLAQAMGLEAATELDVGDDQLPPVAGEGERLEPLFAEALANRPDIAALEQQARAQELTLGSLRGAYLPMLGASTGIATAGQALDSTATNWNATATLTWNLFQGWATHAQSREAQANLDAARAQVALLRQQTRVDVEQSRLAVRAAKQALSAADVALVNAQQRLRLAERRYETGVGSAIELGDAQVALTTAAAQRVQAEYSVSTSRAQLLRALGREVPGA